METWYILTLKTWQGRQKKPWKLWRLQTNCGNTAYLYTKDNTLKTAKPVETRKTVEYYENSSN